MSDPTLDRLGDEFDDQAATDEAARAVLAAHTDWVEARLAEVKTLGKAAVEAALVGAATWIGGPGAGLLSKGVVSLLTKATEAGLKKVRE